MTAASSTSKIVDLVVAGDPAGDRRHRAEHEDTQSIMVNAVHMHLDVLDVVAGDVVRGQ